MKNKQYKDIIELLNKRQSVREYADKAIPRRLLLSCLEAARLSPSACNVQPWEFVIIDDKELKERFCEIAFGGKFFPNRFAAKAPVVIAVLENFDKKVCKMTGYIHGENYHFLDIGIACSNLMLRAYELNIGACMLGWFDTQGAKKILGVGKEKNVITLIALGYPKKGFVNTQKNRKRIEEIAKFNFRS